MPARMLKRIYIVGLALLFAATPCVAQKKTASKPSRPAQATPASELENLRQRYIDATKEYKASLEKLVSLYEKSVAKANDRLAKSKQLFADGLISRNQVTESEEAVAAAELKIAEVRHQMNNADAQIAQALLEVEGEKQMAKLGRIARGKVLSTAAFIRYNGAGNWVLSQSGKIEQFFQQTFKHALPIAVFGQGAIHNQWRLDHRNAMDISLNPNGAEGQALINFLQTNGIPFSAFRTAIPGVATGPHIHIGRPSHRY